MASEMMRHVRCENREISYLLEQKPVKNLNLRIHKDGRVFLSANPDVPASEIDAFILSKASYIFAAQDKFAEIARYSPQPKQWRNLLFSGAWFAPESCFCRKRNRIYGWRLSVSERQKHHRLQQKATVGYPILGPSM